MDLTQSLFFFFLGESDCTSQQDIWQPVWNDKQVCDKTDNTAETDIIESSLYMSACNPPHELTPESATLRHQAKTRWRGWLAIEVPLQDFPQVDLLCCWLAYAALCSETKGGGGGLCVKQLPWCDKSAPPVQSVSFSDSWTLQHYFILAVWFFFLAHSSV